MYICVDYKQYKNVCLNFTQSLTLPIGINELYLCGSPPPPSPRHTHTPHNIVCRGMMNVTYCSYEMKLCSDLETDLQRSTEVRGRQIDCATVTGTSDLGLTVYQHIFKDGPGGYTVCLPVVNF